MLELPRSHSTGDKRLAILSLGSLLLLAGVFVYLVGHIGIHGFSQLSLAFITEHPVDAGRAGGIGPILSATFLILLCCLVVVLPLGMGGALFLHFRRHNRRPLWRYVRSSLDILASAPSIVFGLFGNAFFSIYLGMGFSILSGGLTLACMVLPFFIRTSEAALNALPAQLISQSRALGLSNYTLSLRILLPQAWGGILVALIISVGRALAETAALVFTAGYVMRMPESLLDSGRSLSVHILDLAINVPGGNQNAYASALVLMLFLLLINMLAYHLSDVVERSKRKTR